MSETAVPVAAYAGPRAYKLFNVRLLRKRPLSHCLWRFTFVGLDVRRMATAGPDQPIKCFFPGPDGQPPRLVDQPDWYAAYKKLDPATRCPIRTYTIRH